MRLWHQSLIPNLPRKQLLGQHRECCALRGLGWGRKHSTVDYVFLHGRERLFAYHFLVMMEMRKRRWIPDSVWYSPEYCGSRVGYLNDIDTKGLVISYSNCEDVDESQVLSNYWSTSDRVYLEHDDKYLYECIDNLAGKNIFINRFMKQENLW